MKTKLILLLMGIMALQSHGQKAEPTEAPNNKLGMIKVTILYPNGEGVDFDMDYYRTKHMPMVAEVLGSAMKFYEIDQGVAGRTPDEPVPYLAVGYLYFEKLSDYQNSFGPNADKIVGDIPNYTNSQPMVQISKVLQ